MIGVVLIAQGELGRELKAAVENMLGPQESMAAVSVTAGQPLATMRKAMNDAVSAVSGKGEGVLILTDMFGSTPCNIATGLATEDEVLVLTGVNLPMLVTVARARKCSGLLHVAQSALESGRQYIGFAEAPKSNPKKAAVWAKS